VLKLPWWGTPVELRFTGLQRPVAVAVDSVGNIYVADDSNRVLKAPWWETPVDLRFTGLKGPKP